MSDSIDRLDDLLFKIGTAAGGSYAELIDVAADVVSESRRETAPQIIRNVEELEALDPETMLWDSVGALFQAKNYLHAGRALSVLISDFPAVVVATADQVRTARKALEEA